MELCNNCVPPKFSFFSGLHNTALGRLDSPGLCLGFELFFDFGTLDRLRVNVFSFSGSRGPFGRPFGYKFNVIEFSSIYIYIIIDNR